MFPQMLFRAAGPLSLILLIAGGCSSYDLQQMYSGPRKAPDDVARLRSTEHAFACQIDGRTLRSTGQWSGTGHDNRFVVYELTPGRHHVVAASVFEPALPGSYVADLGATASFDFEFEAGKDYSFGVAETVGGGRRALSWTARLTDRDTGEPLAAPVSTSLASLGKP